VCTVCGAKDTVTPHTPGPEATEEAPQLCTICSFEIAPKKAHEHNYTGEWHKDANGHWQTCKCGEKSTPAAHDWDEGKITKQPTLTENGEKLYTCKTCKCEKTVELELLPVEDTSKETESSSPETTTPETKPHTTAPETTNAPTTEATTDNTQSFSWFALIIGLVIGAGIGILGTVLIQRRKRI
jgi:hypothetical protein